MDRDHPTELIPMPSVSEFEVVLRGYDRSQVREAMQRLESDVRIAVTDREAAVARSSDLASQLSAVHAEMESLRRKLATSAVPTYETMGERIANMLRLAEEEAAEIRRTAHTDTAAARAELQTLAEQSAADRERATTDIQRTRAQAEQTAKTLEDRSTAKARAVLGEAEKRSGTLVADAQAKATGMVGEAEAVRQRTLADTRQRAEQADEDYEISLRARRTEASRAEADRLRSSTEDATRRVAEARETAARLVAEAEAQRVSTLRDADQRRQEVDALRAQALGQLRDVRTLLAQLPTETEPLARTGSSVAGPATATAQTPAQPDSAGGSPALADDPASTAASVPATTTATAPTDMAGQTDMAGPTDVAAQTDVAGQTDLAADPVPAPRTRPLKARGRGRGHTAPEPSDHEAQSTRGRG